MIFMEAIARLRTMKERVWDLADPTPFQVNTNKREVLVLLLGLARLLIRLDRLRKADSVPDHV